MKKIFLSLLLISAILVFGLLYYLFPVNTNKVFPHIEQISYLDFGYYINEGEVEKFSVQLKDTEEINRIINIFSSTSYKRSLGNENIKNNASSISFIVFYSDSNGDIDNYEVIFNNQGYILSNNKKFKINEDKKGEIFNQLYESFIN